MSEFIQKAVVASALSAGAFLGVQHEVYAGPAQDAGQETTTTITSSDCDQEDIADMIKVPIEGTNKYQIVNGITGTVCALETVDGSQTYNNSQDVKKDELPLTGNHTPELAVLGLGFVATGLILDRLGAVLKTKKV